MASGKHIGKVVIKVRDEEKDKVIKPVPKLMTSIPRTYMHKDKCYILIGKRISSRIQLLFLTSCSNFRWTWWFWFRISELVS